MNRAFHSKNADGGDNFLNYRNDDVDAWLDELGTTLDETERKELLSKIQKQIMEDVPSLFIDHIDHIYAVNNRIEGYHVTPTDSYQFYTIDVKE